MTTPSSQDPRGSGRSHDSSPGGPPRYTPAGGQQGAGQYGSGYGGGPQGGPPPPPVRRLLTLTLVSAALYLLSGVVSAVVTATMDVGGMYERMGLPADQAAQADSMAGQMGGITALTTVITLAVGLGIYALVYVFLRKGANWARILGIVLAVLSAVNQLFGFFGAWLFGSWGIVLVALGLAVVVVNVLWVVTAFKAPVRDWFAGPRYGR
jgi:hypothetical protein